MRIIFAGTPDFAAVHLHSLLQTPHAICAVYTQPDRPAGRGRKLAPGPVKQLAAQHGLEIRQPATLNTEEEAARLVALNADLMIVVAYGIILKQGILDAPRLGCLNVHASLLPRWRGAAPIQRALEAGDQESGISFMQMVAALDAGPVLTTVRCPIHADDTAATLHDRLAALGAASLPQCIEDYQLGRLCGIPQNEQDVSYARKLAKNEAQLNWQHSARQLDCQIRAYHPWPVASTCYKGQVLRIHAARVMVDTPNDQLPGTIVGVHKQGIDVATGEGLLRLQILQLAGRKPLDAGQFLNGIVLQVGDTLG